jgi:hypothetical protein
MLLFRALAEDIGEHLRPHFPTLQAIFAEVTLLISRFRSIVWTQSVPWTYSQALRDSHERVRTEGLRAIGVIVELVNTQNKVFFSRSYCLASASASFYVRVRPQDEVAGLHEVMPILADVVRAALAAGEEDATNVALGSTFSSFAYAL